MRKYIILMFLFSVLMFTIAFTEKVRFIEITGNLTVPSTEILAAIQETKIDPNSMNKLLHEIWSESSSLGTSQK